MYIFVSVLLFCNRLLIMYIFMLFAYMYKRRGRVIVYVLAFITKLAHVIYSIKHQLYLSTSSIDGPSRGKTNNVVSEQVHTNRAVQAQKRVRSLKFRI